MSLAAPAQMSLETALVSNRSESVLSVIEKCLDNGLGSCLVVGGDHPCVQVPAEKRLPLMGAAHTAQIETRPFYHPLTALLPYGKYARSCPNTIKLSATGVNLPTSHSVDERVVGRVARVFQDVFA